MTFSLPSLDSTLSILSAMITPAVMILAISSLILTTTNRFVRIVDRVREMLPEFEKLVQTEKPDEAKVIMLFAELGRATVRASHGQHALAQLYLALGAFLATSIALGVVTYAQLDAGWMPLLLGWLAWLSCSAPAYCSSSSRGLPWRQRTRRWTTSVTSAAISRPRSFVRRTDGGCFVSVIMSKSATLAETTLPRGS